MTARAIFMWPWPACLRKAFVLIAGLAWATSPVAAAEPDLNGVWVYAGGHVQSQKPADVFQTGEWPPGGTPQLREPYASELRYLRQRQQAWEAQGKLLVDDYLQCKPNGMPAMMASPLPMEILQTPGKIVVIAEEVNQVRRIYLNEAMPELRDIAPSYNGYSVGHWEGGTLVVETRAVRTDVRWNDVPHSPARTVTEHLLLKSPDVLENRITIDDPSFMISPHSFTIEYHRDRDPAHRLGEFICDNNRYEAGPDGEYRLRIDATP